VAHESEVRDDQARLTVIEWVLERVGILHVSARFRGGAHHAQVARVAAFGQRAAEKENVTLIVFDQENDRLPGTAVLNLHC
jgi:hypothetical protein